MNLAAKLDVNAEIKARVIRADGSVVDIGTITSPYNDPVRNWCWKKAKALKIRYQLNRWWWNYDFPLWRQKHVSD
jgi:hypothetical protein